MVASGKIAVSGDSGTWGRIHLGENASVATNLLAATDTANKVFVGTHGSIQAQNLTLTGDNLAINADARIKANSLTLTPDTTNGDFTVTAGQLFLKGEDGSALNVTGTGGLSVNGSSSAPNRSWGNCPATARSTPAAA